MHASADHVRESWSNALRLPARETDDFFDVGGDSVIALQLAATLTNVVGCHVPVRTIFENSVLRDLLAEIERLAKLESQARGGAPRRGTTIVATSPTQAIQLVLNRAVAVKSFPTAHFFDLHGRVDDTRLRAALNKIIQRHSALRVCYPEPLQPDWAELPAEGEWPLHVRTGSDRSDLFTSFAKRAFDLTTGPVVRAVLQHEGPERSLLALAVDHMAFDGESIHVLLRDLASLYENADSLSEQARPLQYHEYAAAQRAYLASPEGLALSHRWLERFEARGFQPQLHIDPSVAHQDLTGPSQTVRRSLDPEVTKELPSLARARRCTMFMLIAAAFLHALRKISTDDVLGLRTADLGRNWPGTADAIGWFAESIEMWADVPLHASFDDVLTQVRAQTLATVGQTVPVYHLLTHAAQLTGRHYEVDKAPSLFAVPHVFFYVHLSSPKAAEFDGLRLTAVEPADADEDLQAPVLNITADLASGRPHLLAKFVRAAYPTALIEALLDDTASMLRATISAKPRTSAVRANG